MLTLRYLFCYAAFSAIVSFWELAVVKGSPNTKNIPTRMYTAHLSPVALPTAITWLARVPRTDYSIKLLQQFIEAQRCFIRIASDANYGLFNRYCIHFLRLGTNMRSDSFETGAKKNSSQTNVSKVIIYCLIYSYTYAKCSKRKLSYSYLAQISLRDSALLCKRAFSSSLSGMSKISSTPA